VRFYRVTDLVTQLLEAREERQLSRIRGQLSKLDLLVLDELGYVPMGKAGAELLFDVMSRAYERMSLIVTTNLPFENWTEVLDNERLTGATLDRLTHRCHIVETGGESYRLKDARRGRRPREVYKPEAESSKGPEQTPVYKDRPGAETPRRIPANICLLAPRFSIGPAPRFSIGVHT
jgi:hypothetical protein